MNGVEALAVWASSGGIAYESFEGSSLGGVTIIISTGVIYFNWRQLTDEGVYSMKMAAFGPVGVVGGLFLLLFPGKAGKPEAARDKVNRAAGVRGRTRGGII